MSVVPNRPAAAPTKSQILAYFTRELPNIEWYIHSIEARHIDVEGTACDVIALQGISHDRARSGATLCVEIRLPCSRASCFCDYAGKPEVPEDVDQIVRGFFSAAFECRQL